MRAPLGAQEEVDPELTLATMGGVSVDGAKVITADIIADNGVIHVIDSVVLPT